MHLQQLKEKIILMADLSDIKIFKIRKSKKSQGYFVYKAMGESVYVGLEHLDAYKNDFYKFFGVKAPKVVQTYINPEYVAETKEIEETSVIEEVSSEQKEEKKEVSKKVKKQTVKQLEEFNNEVVEILDFYGTTKEDEFTYTMSSEKIGLLTIKLDNEPSKVYSIYTEFKDTEKAIQYFNIKPYNGKLNSQEFIPEQCLFFIDEILNNYNQINGINLQEQIQKAV